MRYIKARNILTKALRDGRLKAASYKSCPIGILLEHELGYPDGDWGLALVAHLTEQDTSDDVRSIQHYASILGYSVEEIVEIEGAFEGIPMVPGIRRLSLSRDESLEDRLERVFWVMEVMDKPREEVNHLVMA